MATPDPIQTWTDIPERLGRYHVLGIAGRGNMGVVYTGYDPYLDQDVAIKVCTVPGHSADADSVARKLFYNEAHTAGALDHPNILKILDAGEHADQLYIVMEYVDGGQTLERNCVASKLLAPRTVAEVGYTCAKALDYAHRQGIIHRDIKSTNILFTADGNLKIGDFGIAQHAFAETIQVQGIVGTPHYMSPEQVRQDKLNGQTDLYSLGVLMFQLLTGRFPFSGDNISNLLYNVCHREPAPLRTLRSGLPEPLCHVVEWAMQKDRNKRYATGRELASDLAAIFAELEMPADADNEDERFRLTRPLRFFCEFSDQELWEILRASRWESYEPGEEIVAEGNLDMSFFVIVSGEVAVMKRAQTLGVLRDGDCFGEMGYLGGSKRTASIRAARCVSLMKISAAVMEQASTACQLRFNKAFVRVLVERLSRTSDNLSQSLERLGDTVF
jgi:serine/threonine protein kinase